MRKRVKVNQQPEHASVPPTLTPKHKHTTAVPLTPPRDYTDDFSECLQGSFEKLLIGAPEIGKENGNARTPLSPATILPPELWLQIFAYLPPKTVIQISRTCIDFATLALDDAYWKRKCAGVNCVDVRRARSCRPFKRGVRASWFDRIYPSLPDPLGTGAPKHDPQDACTPLNYRRVYAVRKISRRAWIRGKYTYLRIPACHAHGITHILALPDGKVLTAGWDGCVKTWRLKRVSSAAPAVPDAPHPSPDMSQRQGVEDDGMASIEISLDFSGAECGDVKSGAGTIDLDLLDSFSVGAPVGSLFLANDLLLVGSKGTGSLSCWSLSQKQKLNMDGIPAPLAPITTAIYSDGAMLVSAHKNSCRVVDVAAHSVVGFFELENANICMVKIFKNVGGTFWLFTVCAFGVIYIWKMDAKSGRTPNQSPPIKKSQNLLLVGTYQTISGIQACKITQDDCVGWSVTCGFKDGNVRGYKIIRKLDTLTFQEKMLLTSLGDWITCMHQDYLSDIVIAGFWDGAVRIWDIKSRLYSDSIQFCPLRKCLKTNKPSAVLSFAVVGTTLVTGNYDGSIVVYDFSHPAK